MANEGAQPRVEFPFAWIDFWYISLKRSPRVQLNLTRPNATFHRRREPHQRRRLSLRLKEALRNYFGDELKCVWPSAACIISWQAARTPRQGNNWIMVMLCFIPLLPLSLSLSLSLLAKTNQLWRCCCRFPLISPRSPEHWWRALKNCTISREPTSGNAQKKKKKKICLHWVAHPCNHWQPFGWKTACSLWVIGTSSVLEKESDHPEGTPGSQLESSIKPGNILLERRTSHLLITTRAHFLSQKKTKKNATHCGAANNNEASITDEVSRWGMKFSGK